LVTAWRESPRTNRIITTDQRESTLGQPGEPLVLIGAVRGAVGISHAAFAK